MRSTYIYIVQDSWGEIDAAFTVKHEMETYLKHGHAPERHSVVRVRDGGEGGNTIIKEFGPAPLP